MKIKRTGPMTVKQAVLVMVVVAILWIPMLTFLIWFSDGFSPRQIGVIGMVNMAIGLTLLNVAWYKWIRNLK